MQDVQESSRCCAAAVGVRRVHDGEVLQQGVSAGGLEAAQADLQAETAAVVTSTSTCTRSTPAAAAAAAAVAAGIPTVLTTKNNSLSRLNSNNNWRCTDAATPTVVSRRAHIGRGTMFEVLRQYASDNAPHTKVALLLRVLCSVRSGTVCTVCSWPRAAHMMGAVKVAQQDWSGCGPGMK
jgi:hypothetical protein